MGRERKEEYKPLSFSTTMRNPERIADFLKCILPYEGKLLTNTLLNQIVFDLVSKKLYQPTYINKIPKLKAILKSDRNFTKEETEVIIQNSPQNHKEAGFDKGWPSRFDTWYRLPMEFGFVYYEMNSPIQISTTGHMLIDANNENPRNNEKIQNVFLNSMMKYQTNNPFRKNANDNAPLPLLLQVIKLLKDDTEENKAGIFRKELSLIICWPNSDAKGIYNKIKEIRKKYKYTYGDEIMYNICLDILGAREEQKNRFKLSQITGEAVDEFIRKMRITGIISLRGNGRFLDFNSIESEKINYILKEYTKYKLYFTKFDFFKYMGVIDNKILEIRHREPENINDIKMATLNKWSHKYTKEEIIKELNIVCRKGESKNSVLRIIDKPTRLEFLTSIALKQNFESLTVTPNYHVDDEGLPTYTASGGMADIECFDDNCNPLVEVTLMCARNQSITEMPAITRHLKEAIEKYPTTTVFSMLVAPTIHPDTKYMAEFSKYRDNVDILTFSLKEFIIKIKTNNKIIGLLNQ